MNCLSRSCIIKARVYGRRTTQLEDYFEFLAADDIRLKVSRVGIESVLYEYIHREQTPEAIADRFPSLAIEQIYATILYYLRNRATVDAYLADWLEYGRTAREEQRRNPPPVVVRLQAPKAAIRRASWNQNPTYALRPTRAIEVK